MLKTSHKRSILIATGLIVLILIVGALAITFIDKRASAPAVSTSKQSASSAATKDAVMISLPGANPITARIANYSSDSDIWALVNKSHPLSSSEYAPSPITIPNVATRTDKSASEQSVRSDVAPAVEKLFAGAKAAGYDLVLASGYRTAALQKQYFDSYAASDGVDAAHRYSALPGQSEHQTGLAFDITTASRVCYLVACFGDTPEAKWVALHAHEYGFIVRYPEGKEAITGYEYEPWHLRYLGVDLATAVHSSGLTYEETWPYLVKADEQLKAAGSLN